MKFSEKMIRLRKIHGYTQETFSKEVGVSRQSVYKWENGTSYPEVEKLLKIARTLSVTVDDMLNEELGVDEKGEIRLMTEEELAGVKVKKLKKEKEALAEEKVEAKEAVQEAVPEEVKPEAVPEEKEEVAAAPEKVETKAEIPEEVKPEPKPEETPEEKPEPKPELKPQPKPQPTSSEKPKKKGLFQRIFGR